MLVYKTSISTTLTLVVMFGETSDRPPNAALKSKHWAPAQKEKTAADRCKPKFCYAYWLKSKHWAPAQKKKTAADRCKSKYWAPFQKEKTAADKCKSKHWAPFQKEKTAADKCKVGAVLGS
eukprot:gene5027-34813_t